MSLNITGGIVSDIITWVRRIVKTSSDQSFTDENIGDYINRFMSYDLPENVELFELTREYTFITEKHIQKYNTPYIDDTKLLKYQTFRGPVTVDGRWGSFSLNRSLYRRHFFEFSNNRILQTATGTDNNYTFQVSGTPMLRGFINNSGYLHPNVIVNAEYTDGPVYLIDDGNGKFLETRDRDFEVIDNEEAGTIGYESGTVELTFSDLPIEGSEIRMIGYAYKPAIPYDILFYDNYFTLYPIPDKAYQITLEATLTPLYFLSTDESVNYAYLSEYIARGAARKILADNGDTEQFTFYEPLFRECEKKILRKTLRLRGEQAVPTVYDQKLESTSGFYGRSGGYGYGYGNP